jgi:hypothetical protein
VSTRGYRVVYNEDVPELVVLRKVELTRLEGGVDDPASPW